MNLSILIATYKRKELLMSNLSNVFSQVDSLPDNLKKEVEVIVSVNPSGDGTEDYLDSLPDREYFKYLKREINVGAEGNMLGLIEMASGKYVWLVSDDDELAQGLIQEVLLIMVNHTDIGWIYINSVALSEQSDGTEKILSVDSLLEGGYYQDGIVKLEELWRKMPGNILFQTSNIYLRKAAIDVMKEDMLPLENACRWPFNIFNSIVGKGAYIISRPSILQGPARSWSDRFFQITCLQFQEMILSIGKLDNYSEIYARKQLRYYLTHEGLVYWIYLFRWFTRSPKKAGKAYAFYLKHIPITCVLLTMMLPIEVLYLAIRHFIVRKFKRTQRHKTLLENKSILPIEWQSFVKE